MKRYDGSAWNILIEWSSGERSWEPLRNTVDYLAADLDEYAKQHHLLIEEGWCRLRKIARRKNKLQRLFKQEIFGTRNLKPFFESRSTTGAPPIRDRFGKPQVARSLVTTITTHSSEGHTA
jgi:hypothetical protein